MSILLFKSMVSFERKRQKRQKIFMAFISCFRDRIYIYYANIDNIYPKHFINLNTVYTFSVKSYDGVHLVKHAPT
jgi:hypothetical protein